MLKRLIALVAAAVIGLASPASAAAPTYFGNMWGIIGAGISQFYVSTAGSDTVAGGQFNLCNVLATPCRTIRHATTEAMLSSVNINNPATINIAAGTYTESVPISGMPPFSGQAGGFGPTILYLGANQATTIWNNDPLDPACFTIAPQYYAVVALQNLTIKGTNGCASAIFPNFGGQVSLLGNVTLGGAVGADIELETGSQVLIAAGSFTVSGNANNLMTATENSVITAVGSTITFVGNPVFSGSASSLFRAVENSSIDISGAAFSGSVTGTSYYVSSNSTIFANNASCASIPGSIGGVIVPGGLCVNSYTSALGLEPTPVCNPQISTFTGTASDTSGTYTTPVCNGVTAYQLAVRVVGGGGGGGGSGTSGAGNGGAGDTSTFGTSLLTANAGAGGGAGNGTTPPTASSGGSATGGNLANIPGGAGTNSGPTTTGSILLPAGQGGHTPLGNGGYGGGAGQSTGGAGQGCGAGGGGAAAASTSGNFGGAGGGAGGYVEYLLLGPVTSYTYTAGKFGAGGTSGVSGGTGGNAAPGCIIIVARWGS